LWLTHTLSLAPPENVELQQTIRANLANWKHQLRPLRGLLQHEERVERVIVSPHGDALLTIAADHKVRLWSVSGELLKTLDHP
ncbi:hypothetical protein ACMWP3_25435, partial [Escherichia coli]|uniref:hypothetical protein n=1 Tax=Escherichia coli TaxID=562 RepID=UPI0039E1F561